jgi:hypothetical protein
MAKSPNEAPKNTDDNLNQDPNTQTTAPVVIDWTAFALEADYDMVPDENAVGIAAPTPELPYRKFFTDNLAKCLQSDPEHGTIIQPNSFAPLGLHQAISTAYAEGKGTEPKVVKLSEVKSKVSDQFKKWQDQKDAPKERKLVKLMFAERAEGFTGNDPAFKALGPGIRFWMVKL